MAEGEFALVRRHLEQALPKPALPPGNVAPGADHDLYAMLADVCALQRDLDGLQKYAPLAEDAAARSGHKLYLGIAHRARGVAHRLAREFSASEDRLQKALALFLGLEARWQIGRTLFELGELAAARMDTASARDYFARALAAFDSLRAIPDAERARKALESLEAFN
jgi:tetratricopeptide (TPR) repeat protein